MWPRIIAILILLFWSVLASAHYVAQNEKLPAIGPAPPFALTSQDGTRVTLEQFRGKVVAVTFIFTSCADICPLLTAKMVQVQDELGRAFGARIVFISITVTPGVLKDYARNVGADLRGWVFLTGTQEAISDVTSRYGIFAKRTANGDVGHSLLTSLVDSRGIMRVQYLGVRFDPEEFRRDLISLADES